MPDPVKLLPMLKQAAQFTRNTPGRSGRIIELQEVDEIIISGDLHGNIPAFQTIYKAADLSKHPRRHLVLQEVIHSPFRYPNGGDKSHQLLDLYAALKCQHPNQVHLIMGNHEMSQWTDRKVMKNDEDYNEIFFKGIIAAYGVRAEEIYRAYFELFEVFPLVLRTPNRGFISHSLPTPKHLTSFELNQLAADDLPKTVYAAGGPAYALVWGRDVSAGHVRNFLEKVNADWLITGHIPCENGFATPNDQQIILDSATSPATYLCFPANRLINTQEMIGMIRKI